MRLKHFLSVFLTLLTLSVGQMWGDTYTKITSTSSLSNGDVVILAIANGNSPSTGVTGGTVQASTSTKKDATVSTTASEWMRFTVSTTTGGWYLINSSSQYVGKPTDNTFYLTTADNCKGVCSVNSDGVLCCNSRYLQKNSSNYRMYSLNANYSKFLVWKVTSSTPSYTITAQSSNNTYGTVSLDGSVITATPAEGCRIASTAYDVTSGTATVARGTGANINKFTVTPSSNCTVRINFEQTPTHTVTWSANGNTSNTSTVAEGAAIEFPESATGCTGGTFMGWASATISGTQATAPTYVTSANMGNTDITYYAVFADVTTGTGDWEQCASSTIAEGDYLIVQSDYMMTNTLNSNRLNKTSITIYDGIISYDDKEDWSAYIWHIKETSTSGIFTIKNGSNFVVGTGTKSQIDLVTTPSDDKELFAITYQPNPKTYKIESKYNETQEVNRWLRNGGSYFACYADGGYPMLFKRGNGYSNYRTSCCSPLASINGSVSVSNQRSLTLQWEKLSGVDGTTPYTITCKQGTENAGTIGDVDLSGAKATCTVTGLACSTTYTFTITAHGDATHCDKTQENIQGTTSDAMTLPALTYSTGLTAGGANITPSWASAVTHDGSVTYASSNSSVVQIINSSTGEAKPVGAGTATITATYAQSTNNCEAAKTSNTISVTGNVTVTFNANGGGGTMQNQSIPVSTPTNLTANAFTTPSSCKYFYGWATSQANADAGTRAYTDGQSVTITEGLNLYAIWKSYNYEVTKGTGTGAATFSLSANNVDCGGSITVTATPDATHKGNPIVSISPSNKGSVSGTTISNITADITVNVEFAAKESYAITWKVGGQALTGSAIASATNSVLEGGAIENLPEEPSGLTCANTFMGWSKKSDGSVKKAASFYDDLFTTASGAPEITEATTFYAVFAKEGTGTVTVTDELTYEAIGLGIVSVGNATYTDFSGVSATSDAVYAGNINKFNSSSDPTNTIQLRSNNSSAGIVTTVSGGKAKKVTVTWNTSTAATRTITIYGKNTTAYSAATDLYNNDNKGEQLGELNVDNATNNVSELTITGDYEFIGIRSKSGALYLDEVDIQWETTGATLTDYVTECAAVEAPEFDPEEGTYNEVQSVELSSATEGVTIKYTTDGTTEPSKTVGTTYSETIAVNQSMTIKAIAIKGEDVSAISTAAYVLQVPTPTISGATAFVNSSTVTITCEGADHIYYTTNGSAPTTSSTEYDPENKPTVSATTTIKAIAVKANWENSAVASQAFTKITPLTVAQARSAIDETPAGISNQFVKGIISQIDSYNSTYNSITYWISDDGTTTNQLQVYSGLAGVVKDHFEATTDINVGEEVIVNGTLKKHNNSVYEFDYNNTIVAYRPYSPIEWSAGACTAELNGEENEYPTLNNAAGLTISYESTDEAKATIDESGIVTPVAVGSTTIKATSAANDNYVATTVSYTLTVSPTVTRVDLDIECNGATSGCPETTHLVKQTNLPDPLPAVAKAGKNFGGWYTDNTFETPAVAGASITENTTIYAQWLDPYTVAEALTIISGLGANNANTISTEYYYVAGVVTNDAVSVSSNTATYKIQDAGESNELTVYKGKGLDNVNVTEASQIQEADEVVVYGLMQNYYGTAQIAQGNYIHSQVRPTYDVTGVTVSPTAANIRAGKTVALTATITPSYATNKNVTWSVKSGDAYAEVSATGVVTGLAAGTAVIEVETEDGGFKAECTVTVAAELPTFTEDDHEWIKVTNASKLVAGRFYVIAREAANYTMTKNIDSYAGVATSTIENGVIAYNALGSNTAIFELGGTSSAWTLTEVSTDAVLGATTGKNFSWEDNQEWTIAIDEDKDVSITNTTSSCGVICYNTSATPRRFKPYADASTTCPLPQLYMWAELSHSVTFDANGGVAESVPGVERTDEGSIIIPATTPTHSDISKAFGGWYKSDAPGTLYNAGDEFSTNVDITLYAKWNTVPTYTVTYVPGGTGTVPAVAFYREGQEVQVEEASLSNPGYSFAGWTVKDAEQNVLPLDEENKFDMPASNVTITAVWSRISSQKWNLVKHGESLEIDGEYVIVYHNGATQKALGAISSSIGTAINVTIDGDYLKGSEAMKVLTLKKGKDDKNYAFKNGDNYLTWSSGNSLNESTTLDNASSWTIEIGENNKVDIKNVGTTTRYLQYNTGSPRFACYTNTQQKVLLFKKVANLIVEDEQTKTAAQVDASDITVKEDGKLTINVDAEGQAIGDITVEDGGELIIAGSKHIKVNNVYISSTMASGKSSQMSGALAQLDIQGEVYFDITLGDGGNANKWHAFTVPFPVDAINGVFDLNNTKLNNEEHYAIMEYLGDVRAQGKYGWKKIRTTLVPGTFYLMTVDGLRTTYRFKKTADGALVAGNSKEIFEYAKSGDGQSTDAGWNGIGNPNLFYGKVGVEVQVLDPEHYVYVKKDPNSTNFVVGTPFFYQAAGNGSIEMLTADAGASYAPARTQAKGIEKIKVAFGNEAYTDYLDISASEEALNEYQIGKDLAKMTMTSTPKVAQIFGKAYNTKLCMVYAPMSNDQAVYDLSLYAPANGEYTIAAPEVENADLYLTKDGAIIWNLTMGAYPMGLKKGNTEGYGLLLKAKAPQTPTGVEQSEVSHQPSDIQKIIINDNVFILRGGQLYGIDGKLIK